MAFSCLCLAACALLVRSAFTQPSDSSGGVANDIFNAEQKAEIYANETFKKLATYTATLRSNLGSADWAKAEAATVEGHAAHKNAQSRAAVTASRSEKLHALVTVSVKEADLGLNRTQFDEVRAKRADLLAGISEDNSVLDGFNDALKSQLMQSEICGKQKVHLAEAQELENSAQTAAADLAIIVGVAEKLSSDQYSSAAARSAGLKQRIADEGATAKKLIESVPDAVEAQIDGLSGGCEDKAKREAEAKEKQEKEKKEEHDKHEHKHHHDEDEDEEEDEHHHKHKKGKGGKGGKGKKYKHKKHKHHKEMFFFLADAALTTELVDTSSAFKEELDVQNSNINNLKKLQEQAEDTAKKSLANLVQHLQAINSKDFGSAAARAHASKIVKDVSAQFAQKRAASLGDLQKQLRVVAKLASNASSDAYQAAVTASHADMADVQKIGQEETESSDPTKMAEEAAEAEKAVVEQSFNAVHGACQVMSTYEAAIKQLQDKAGEKSGADSQSSECDRMEQVSKDGEEVADIIIDDFYSEVRRYIAQDVAKLQPSALFELEEQHSSQGSVALFAAMAGLGVMGAVAMTVQARRRKPTINTAPLLG